MARRGIRRVLLASGVALATLFGTGNAAGAAAHEARALPDHVFAPYFQAYTDDDAAVTAAASGARYLTMAFIQTATPGSCTAYWNGDTSQPIGTFAAQVRKIQAMGGDVVPSFGGFTADDTGTEIADSCADVHKIAKVYESVLETYHIARLDFDVEDLSLDNTAGIDRRNRAIAEVEAWAAGRHRPVEFVYTLPSSTRGLEDTGVAILTDAKARHARIDVVNIMTFDYYDDQPHEMAADTVTAANGLHAQLHRLYPDKSSTALWHMIGVTEMIGIDDFGPAETFTLADAHVVAAWAAARGLAETSFWALGRDNGKCPGDTGADDCSGLTQHRWAFSHVFEPVISR